MLTTLDPVEEQRWLEGLAAFDQSNRNAIMAIFAAFGVPDTYLDIGCGTGAMVKTARALGSDAYGIDRLPHSEDYLHQLDLREPIHLNKQFKLITSIECVEHIEAQYETILCDNITRHLANDGILVLTSAPPGQEGDGHHNCQPAEYWRARMVNRGLTYYKNDTMRLSRMWEATWMIMHWLEKNVQVFRKVFY